MIKITETRLREGIQFGLGSNGIWTPELENEIVEEIRKQALSQHDVSGCVCDEENKHGWTTIKCCNRCGLSIEEFWNKHIH